MSDLSSMGEIEQVLYSQLESAKKIFQIVQQLTTIAREVDTDHQVALQALAHDLLQIGKDISDNADKLTKDLGRIIWPG